MANIASNEAIVVFKEGVTVSTKEDFYNDLKEELEIYNDCSFDINDKTVNVIELSFGSRWNEPIELLQKLCDEYKCSIYGVCYEWGCLYVNHYEITPLIP